MKETLLPRSLEEKCWNYLNDDMDVCRRRTGKSSGAIVSLELGVFRRKTIGKGWFNGVSMRLDR